MSAATSECDFIIVGGGTAGLVLAARLTEDADVRVLVLEAGEDLTADPRVSMPAMWQQLMGTDADWKLKTVPQTALGNRELPVPQGRLLGGSSAMNGMNFTPAAQEELDAWEKLGNPGWDWESFNKYLRKTYALAKGENNTENNGVLSVNLPEEETKWPQVWRDTFAGLGFPSDNDPFSGQIRGTVTYPDAIHPVTKTRSFSGNDYLGPARSRQNLTLWTGATVDRILFDQTPEGAVATGVQYTKNGTTQTVSARREVILSAGAFHSPKILELSGVGDAKLLQKLGIDLVVDNPFVGENLQNHPMFSMAFEARDDDRAEGFETLDAMVRQDPAAIQAVMEAYTTKQRGPFSQSNCNIMAQLPLPEIATASGKQDLAQILESLDHADATTKATPEFARAHEALVRSVLNSPTIASATYFHIRGWAYFGPLGRFEPIPAGNTQRHFTILVLLTHPLSRGSSHIRTAQGNDLAIDPNYLAHPLDVEVLARHARFLETTLARAQPLAARLKQDSLAAPPGWPRGFSADLDEARRFVRETGVGAMHYTGTCSMMPREKGGVVDHELRVYGTRNVRVVDASIMPFVTRANTMATVYGIAEKAAVMIRERYSVGSA